MPYLAAYLPPRLVRRLASHPPTPPCRETLEAAMLLSDVSGFTALTEDLQAAGRSGAEEIARAIDRAFRPAISAIERAGGSIETFAGDALLALFEGAGAVPRARAAAAAILAWARRHPRVRTPAGPRSWAIAQVVHHGRIDVLTLGTAERRTQVLVGSAVRALARMESRAGPGQILVSAAARRRSGTAPRRRAAERPAPLEALRWHLPAPLRPMMARAEVGYRRASVLFLESRGEDLASMQRLCLAMQSALDRYGGVLLKTDVSPSGVRWLCLFGLPETHEDDPDRAAGAALHVLGESPRGIDVRGGLHAGTVASVVIGTSRRRSFDVMGDVVNTAARALGAAAWGEVLVAGGTRDLLGRFSTRPRAARAVKGKRLPLELHALERSRAPRAVSAPPGSRAMAPLVGRDVELDVLRSAIEVARGGGGVVVSLCGEPGVGKSRLRMEAARLATAQRVGVHEGRAVPFGGAPLQAIGDIVRSLAGVPAGAAPPLVEERARASCESLAMDAREAAHLVRVMGSTDGSDLLRHLSPETLRSDDAIVLRRFLAAHASRSPVLLVLEDLHWADERTVGAVHALSADGAIPGAVLLLVHRPGFTLPPGARTIPLREIAPEDASRLVRGLLGGAGDALVERLAERAGGNPLHLEELVRHLRDSGLLVPADGGWRLAREPTEDDLPPTLEALIASRLDRLSPAARRAAQVASVVGRRFPESTVARVAAPDDLAGALAELESREVAFPAEDGLRVFKHALVRDVAYGSILLSERRKLHRGVALAMEEGASDAEQEMAALGHHWELAGDAARARACYLRAARRAYDQHAFEETVRLAAAHRRLGRRAGIGSVRATIELEVRARFMAGTLDEAGGTLGAALRRARTLGARREEGLALRWMAYLAARRGSARLARRHFQRAIDCLVEAGDGGSEATVRDELGIFLRDSGDFDGALREHDRAVELARASGDPMLEATVRGNRSSLLRFMHRYDDARSELLVVRDVGRRIGHERTVGIALGSLATLDLDEGRYDAAAPLLEEALSIVRRLGDVRAECAVLGNLAVLHGWRGDPESAIPLYERVLQLSDRLGEPRNRAISLQNLGGLLAMLGRAGEAAPVLREAVAIYRKLGARRHAVECACALGEILAESDLAAAEETLRDAVRDAGPDVEDPEPAGLLARLAGVLARARGDDEAAREHLRRSRALLARSGNMEELARAERELGKLPAEARTTAGT